MDLLLQQKQTHRLLLTTRQRLALAVLKMTLLELKGLIEEELLQNPLLQEIEEEIDHEFDLNFYSDVPGISQEMPDVEERPSLYAYLMEQAKKSLPDEDIPSAELIIGSLEPNGMLLTTLEELGAIGSISPKKLQVTLKKIQEFDPLGVASGSWQERFKQMLIAQGKKDSIAYAIVDSYYSELLHHQFNKIAKGLNIDEETVEWTVKKYIGPLFRAISWDDDPLPKPLFPDLILEIDGDLLKAVLPDEPWPPLKIGLDLYANQSGELKRYMKKMGGRALWLLKAIERRGEVLGKIGSLIATQFRAHYLEGEPFGSLKMDDVATHIGVHHSTIARAVSNKWVETPKGLLPLKSFFSHRYSPTISSAHIRDRVKGLIDQEDRANPLSDKAICAQLAQEGISCSRRSIAKYRTELSIPNSRLRKG